MRQRQIKRYLLIGLEAVSRRLGVQLFNPFELVLGLVKPSSCFDGNPMHTPHGICRFVDCSFLRRVFAAMLVGNHVGE